MIYGCNSTAANLTKKSLLIGIDGFTLHQLSKVDTPYIDELIANGTINKNSKLNNFTETSSGPGWATILTGVWQDKHLVTGNNEFENSNINNYSDIISSVENENSKLDTFSAYSWKQLNFIFNEQIDNNIYYSKNHYIDNIYNHNFYYEADEYLHKKTLEHLESDEADLSFIYYGHLDETAHQKGRGSAYLIYLSTLDKYIGDLLRTIESRNNYKNEHWLIAIATDHGITSSGTHGGFSDDEMNTIFLIKDNKGYVNRGYNIDNANNVNYFSIIWYHMFGEFPTGVDSTVVGYNSDNQ